jgi:hypothetical protein
VSAQRFQVTPSLSEFWVDAGTTVTLTNIGSSIIYGKPDTMFPGVGSAAWSLAPGVSRTEDVGAVWVRAADGTSSTLTIEPVATGTFIDVGTGMAALPSGVTGSTSDLANVKDLFEASTQTIVELEASKVFFVDADAQTTAFRIRHRDPSGNIWATDNSNFLWKSTDDSTTWIKVFTATGYVQVEWMQVLASTNILIMVRTAGGVHSLLRSTDSGATFPTTVLTFPTTSDGVLGSLSYCQTANGTIYWGEYGPSGQATMSLYKSVDDGVTWTTPLQYTTNQIRHFHSVQEDQFVPNRVWVTIGDTVTGTPGFAPKIGFSNDGGTSWTWVTQAVYLQGRAVSVMFTSESVYWASDTPDVAAPVWRYDRATTAVTQVTTGLGGPFYYGVSVDGLLAVFGGVESAGNGYVGDGIARALTSNGGSRWTVAQEWAATVGFTNQAVPLGITAPDVNGYFWVNFASLDGTSDFGNNVNVRYRLRQRRLRDRARPAVRRQVRGVSAPFQTSHQSTELITATQLYTLMIVERDLVVVACDFALPPGNSLASDATNYWTGSLRHYRAGALVTNGVICQVGGVSRAWPSGDVVAGQIFNAAYAYCKAGDLLVARYDKTAAPATLVRPTCAVLCRPVPVITA